MFPRKSLEGIGQGFVEEYLNRVLKAKVRFESTDERLKSSRKSMAGQETVAIMMMIAKMSKTVSKF